MVHGFIDVYCNFAIYHYSQLIEDNICVSFDIDLAWGILREIVLSFDMGVLVIHRLTLALRGVP